MMGGAKFAAEAKANPTRYYRRPGEVVRDRRLSRQQKLAILEAWELEARTSGLEPLTLSFAKESGLLVRLKSKATDFALLPGAEAKPESFQRDRQGRMRQRMPGKVSRR